MTSKATAVLRKAFELACRSVTAATVVPEESEENFKKRYVWWIKLFIEQARREVHTHGPYAKSTADETPERLEPSERQQGQVVAQETKD